MFSVELTIITSLNNLQDAQKNEARNWIRNIEDLNFSKWKPHLSPLDSLVCMKVSPSSNSLPKIIVALSDSSSENVQYDLWQLQFKLMNKSLGDHVI